ncbi:MAG: glycosyltransferase family 4 protein [Minicystis sp.]
MKSILYLAPGVFDKGGISRYCRYQIRALREILGEGAVTVLSLAPPDAKSFEDPFAVDFASFGPSRAGKSLFAAAAAIAAAGERPRAVWCAHVGIAPLAVGLARAIGAMSVLNVYGVEVWTDLNRVRAASLRRSDWVVSDCHNTRDYIVAHALRVPERMVVHWDCVDLARFSPGDPGDVLARYGIPSAFDGTTVLTLGRLSPAARYKGYDRLIEVLARLPAGVAARVVIAGDGPTRPELSAQAARLGVQDRVLFTGSIREEDLPAIYRACDVFSLITHAGPGAGEGIPLTPLEAAACGKPILVGNQDGSREAAEDSVSGFVLEPFDLQAIADRLTLLAQDPALRARMGAAARARIEREHGYERFRERVRSLLAEMGLDRPNHRRGR